MFYRDLFASLCFIFFGLALATQRMEFYFGAMMCGAFSITAKKKMWKDPDWAPQFYDRIEKWMDEKAADPKTEYSEEEEIKPLPPLDGKK